MGEAKSRPPKGGGSYSSAASATACLRARSFFGTCRFSTAVIGAVSVRIRHSSADAGTPFFRPLKHHYDMNTVLRGIGCRRSQLPTGGPALSSIAGVGTIRNGYPDWVAGINLSHMTHY